MHSNFGKTFRAQISFSPESNESVCLLSDSDYDVVDTNQAFGVYIKVYAENSDVISVYISPEEVEKYGIVQNRLTKEYLTQILNNISFVKSCVDFDWTWEITEVNGTAEIPSIIHGEDFVQYPSIRGFLINTLFKRPDIQTGKIGTGKGRRMWIEETASETSIVMTAWVCVELIIKHEMMESFLYDNAKILNPHKTLEQLAYPEKFLTL